jgi:hypothetical protein
MPTVLRAIGPAMLLLLLTACPYDGPVPLGEPDAGLFEPGLLGGWASVDSGGPGPLFLQLEGTRYLVVLPDECPEGGGWAYLAEVGGAMFVNIHIGIDSARYHVARLGLDGNHLEIRYLSDRVDSLAVDPESFRRAVAARLDEPFLYEPVQRYAREPSSPTVQGDAAALLQTACIYSGPTTAGEPEPGLLEPRLIGTWIPLGLQAKRFGTESNVEVLPAGPSGYSIRALDGDGDTTVARAYLSRVEGALFLNIQEELLDAEDNFVVARVDFTGDTLRLHYLNAGIAALAGDPARFRAELARRSNDPLLYYRGIYSMQWLRTDGR